MGDLKYGFYLFGIYLIGYIVVVSYRNILPFVAEDEYYISETILKEDKNIRWKEVHSRECRHHRGSKSWFKTKHSKYDFILEDDTYICNECFTEEEAEKMLMLHKFNIESLYRIKKQLAQYGWSQEKIDEEMRQYNLNANIREVYYLE